MTNRFLLIDIGKGTQDIVIPDLSKNEENWPKVILPSPTEKLARRVKKSVGSIRVGGYVMGGGPVNRALIEKMKSGHSVVITKKAAKTVRDDLEEVERLGFCIVDFVDDPDFFLSDLEFDTYQRILWLIDTTTELSQFIVGIACQDHGFIKGQSDRITRFQFLKDMLEKDRVPERLIIREKTNVFSRFDSILEQLVKKGISGFVMDSKLAAVAGMADYARRRGIDEFVVLDVGNAHTMGASVKKGEIAGLFEHHTRMLNREKVELLVKKLAAGSLTFNEVFEDGGHGAIVFESINPEKIFVVGPNRNLLRGYGEEAYPLGDAMLYGCAGFVVASKYLSS